MKVRAGFVTVVAAGLVSVAGCAPLVPGGGAAPAAAPATSTATGPATTPDATGSAPSAVTSSSGPAAPEASSGAAAPTPDAAVQPAASLMTAGTTGTQVRELQARLKQLEWYDGAVTGAYDALTSAAVRGFQSKRGLGETGSVDAATWAALIAQTRQPTADEIQGRLTAGPAILKLGSSGARVRDLQARLKQIGWWSGDVSDGYGGSTVAAVKGFQDKRQIPVTGEVDQRTLDKLAAMTRPPTADELGNVKPAPKPVSAAGLDPRCLVGRTMCISKGTRSLTWVVDGQAKLRMDVRFGSESNPTREGLFNVYIKRRDWTSTIYGSKMPYSMFFSGGEAVHYSSDFAARGYAGASHGCVNVRDMQGIAWLFDQVQLGDRVVVY